MACKFWGWIEGWIKNVCGSGLAIALLTFPISSAVAENCSTAGDMDPAIRTAMVAAAQRDFEFVAKGDAASLRQNAAASLAADFAAIEATIKDNQSALSGSKANARPPFLLEAEGTAPIPHAEFLCGVFGKSGQTAESAVFNLDNLPPGKYGIVILDAGAHTVSLILIQQGSDWKLAGLYIRATQSAGHDSDWFSARAREYKSKGQAHNAWLYFLEARSLISPLSFMSTAATDKLYDESQKAQPTDIPAEGKPADLPAGTVTYKLTALFPEVVGNDLDVVVRYQSANISNSNQTYRAMWR